MRTVITLPDVLSSAAGELAARIGMSHNELYATAIAEFVAKHHPAEVTRRLDELYTSEPSGVDASLRRAQAVSLGEDRW